MVIEEIIIRYLIQNLIIKPQTRPFPTTTHFVVRISLEHHSRPGGNVHIAGLNYC